MLKAAMRHPAVVRALGRGAAAYLSFVRRTSRLSYYPSDALERIVPNMPVIAAMWHGEHFLMPFLRPPGFQVRVMISRHRDGEINAIAAEQLGVGVIRGSGSHGQMNIGKRGALALIEMIAALKEGHAVAMTADVPKVAKVAGLGIVALAKKSGRPIMPAIVVTNRYRLFAKSWDQSKLPLPFGHMVIVVGDLIHVPDDADDETMEAARRAVEDGLNAVMRRAYAIAEGRET